ncbi:MAG: hypothetical protein GF383_13480 [Candidatus Lokiarchaeota archaeon]|nr:hypothetical protein [Candidatus Lokiarchaeota archaeon]MBD3342212.1 hypothetical protein [Candidatus Lokiarchaeota archaeon]
MITGYAIILEDEFLYYSNEKKYAVFEIILFVEKFLRTINPTQTWYLNNILLESNIVERIIIKHFITKEGRNLFFCITGDFELESKEARNMLDDFFNQVKKEYKTIADLKNASTQNSFKEQIKLFTYKLWNQYAPLLEKEKLERKNNSKAKNRVLYCGISSQGLPIISQLYEKKILKYLDVKVSKDNIEVFNSNLSAQLATIEMNALIRAKTSIREIHIVDSKDKKQKKMIMYENIGKYSLDFFASGNFYRLKEKLKELKDNLSKEPILHTEFTGDLKSYKGLMQYFTDLEKKF